MIRFSLKCNQDHSFESWFQSGAAFEKVKGAGMVTCPACGSKQVEKTLMAPRIQTAKVAAPKATQHTPTKTPAPLPDITPEQQADISALKAHVEATSDYVGENFAKEARAMHDGEKPERPIYGEANIKDAVSLIEDGVPLAPLPFIPARKTN